MSIYKHILGTISDGGEQRDRHYAEFADWLMDRSAEYGKTMTYFR